MVNIPKLVLLTPDELESLIQLSVRKALSEQSPQSSFKDDQPLSIEEASKFLKIPKPTLYAYTSNREIPHHKRGKKLLFFKSELLEWVASGKKKTRAEITSEVLNGSKGGAR